MNAVVGAIEQNAASIQRLRHQASLQGVHLVITPELALTGYPPEDLLLREGFINRAEATLQDLRDPTLPPVIVGTALMGSSEIPLAQPADSRAHVGSRLTVANAAAVVDASGVVAVATKRLLPNYDVFDEQRYFQPGVGPGCIINVAGAALGVLICEDIWSPAPAAELIARGATVLVVANASPFARGRQSDREAMLAQRATESNCPIVYVNMVGGQDELVFDGQSVVVDATGTVIARGSSFLEELLVVELEVAPSNVGTDVVAPMHFIDGLHANYVAEPRGDVADVYDALVMGTRDYLRKNGFRSAILGVSGGVDSALVAAIAVDAVGSSAVRGFAMPSRYSSDHSLSDAAELCQRLDMSLDTIAIEEAHVAFHAMLQPVLDEVVGLTDENLQSRIRGLLLMAISNATGAIVLTTGNKSEMATGYSTLYGDSAGGFAVIKDVPKTLVYELCRYRNELAVELGDPEPIPVNILTKAPSAELRPDQRDDQSLPPYDVLDAVLARYIDDDQTASALVAEGYDRDMVLRITGLVDRSEYKRRQMPPGVRISTKAFGRDRRMPITNAFRPEQQ